MKIMNFNEFINESVIANKYDVTDVSKFCKSIIDILVDNKNGVLDSLNKTPGYGISLCSLKTSADIYICRICFDWDSSDQSDTAFISGINYDTLFLTKKWLLYNETSRESIIAHELSHILDKGLHSSIPDKLMKLAGKKSNENPDEFIKSITSDLETESGKAKFLRYYMRKDTEVEAHVGMVAYSLNKLLLAHPDKLNDVKAILRKGDWKIDKIFPEMSSLIKVLTPRIDGFQRVKNKMLKQLGTIVSNLVKLEALDIKVSLELYFPKDNKKLISILDILGESDLHKEIIKIDAECRTDTSYDNERWNKEKNKVNEIILKKMVN